MLFRKNAWVDTEVAIVLAHNFTKHARNKYSDAWILLYLGNLSVHYNTDVRHIYWEDKVFLCYYPPQTSESMQAIDSGLGRSMCAEVGNLLDM